MDLLIHARADILKDHMGSVENSELVHDLGFFKIDIWQLWGRGFEGSLGSILIGSWRWEELLLGPLPIGRRGVSRVLWGVA